MSISPDKLDQLGINFKIGVNLRFRNDENYLVLVDNNFTIDIHFINLLGFRLRDFRRLYLSTNEPINCNLVYSFGGESFSRSLTFALYRTSHKSRMFLRRNLTALILSDLTTFIAVNMNLNSINISIDGTSYDDSSYPKPSNYLFSIVNKILNKLRLSKPRKNHWTLYFRHNLSAWKKIENPTGRWLADPCVLQDEYGLALLCEDFSLSDKLGRISLIRFQNGDFLSPQIVLEKNSHVSFPQVFTYLEKQYVTVEEYFNGGVGIYKFNEIDNRLEEIHRILPGVKIVDPLIFNLNENWYLLGTQKTYFGDNFYSKLHLYYTQNPLEENWSEFEISPLIFSNQLGRNGGIFKLGERIIRVAQETNFDTYGKKIHLREISKISNTEYSEIRLDPSFLQIPDFLTNVHSLSILDGLEVIDGRKDNSSI